jgi:hypothetical protein
MFYMEETGQAHFCVEMEVWFIDSTLGRERKLTRMKRAVLKRYRRKYVTMKTPTNPTPTCATGLGTVS